MQHFKFVNWWFRFLMSRTGYSASSKVACYQLCKQMMTNHKLFSLLDDEGAGVRRAAAAAVLAPSAQARSEELARISFPTIARNKRSISDCAVTVQDMISLAQQQKYETRVQILFRKSFTFGHEKSMQPICDILQDLVQIYLRKSALFDFLYFFMNKIRKK